MASVIPVQARGGKGLTRNPGDDLTRSLISSIFYSRVRVGYMSYNMLYRQALIKSCTQQTDTNDVIRYARNQWPSSG